MDPTAAPTELQLNGKIYDAHPLRDIDHETLNKWVRKAYLTRLEDAIEDSPDLQEAALQTAATMQWSFGPGLRMVMTQEGMHKLANLLCRKDSVPFEACTGAEALKKIMAVFKELHPVEQEEGEPTSSKGDDSPK